ncbi:MAG: MATE family efflux transporter [Cytophagales bacterium]|nr:MATE family efflux transporter [Cytophagales bacterium]
MQVIKYIKHYKSDIFDTVKLSLPIMFGRLGAVMMGVADNIMVGKIGYNEIAASGISNAICFLLAIIPIGLLVIGSPMVSAEASRQNKQGCVNIMKSCIQVSFLVSLVIWVILWLIGANFQYLGQPKDVTDIVQPFYTLIITSIFPLMFFIAVEQFTDGLEKTWISMFFNITGFCVNVGINWLLVYGNWGCPALGLVGAGIGTLSARTYMAVGIWLAVNYLKDFNNFPLSTMNIFAIDKPTFNSVLKTGLPSGFQFFFEVSALSFMAVVCGWFGAASLAAHNIALNIASVTYMISSAFATGGSIRVGMALGMQNKREILRAANTSFMLVTAWMSTTLILLLIFNQYLIQFYTIDAQVLQISYYLVIITAFFQISDGVQIAALGALRALADVNVPALISFCSYWIVGIPAGCALAYIFHLEVYGIWIGMLIGLTISSVLLTTRFYNIVERHTFADS